MLYGQVVKHLERRQKMLEAQLQTSYGLKAYKGGTEKLWPYFHYGCACVSC